MNDAPTSRRTGRRFAPRNQRAVAGGGGAERRHQDVTDPITRSHPVQLLGGGIQR